MNILYGINATGNGHISRSRITISELKKRGHNVTVLFSGRKPEDFFDVDEFCLLYTSPSPRDLSTSRMPSSA